MSDQRRFTWSSGRLPSTPLTDFWQASLTVQDPSVPNLPLETPAAGGAEHSIEPVGHSNAQAFGSHGLNGTIAAAGLANSEAFGAASLNGTIAAAGFASSQSFGAAELQAAISPAGIVGAESFGTVGIAGTVSVSGIASGGAFGSTAFNGTIAVAGLASGEQFGTAEIDLSHTVSPVGIESSEAFGSPQIQASVPPVYGGGGVGRVAYRQYTRVDSSPHLIGSSAHISACAFGRPHVDTSSADDEFLLMAA